MDKKRIFEIIRKYIFFLIKEKKINIKKAYLFGSYAKGNFHKDSDIDLALVMKNLTNKFDMQVELLKLTRNFDTRIEPHPFDEKNFNFSHPFAYEILNNGIKININNINNINKKRGKNINVNRFKTKIKTSNSKY